MRATILLLGLALPGTALGGLQDGQEENAREEIDLRRVFELVKLLEDRLESGTSEAQREALESARALPHDEVARAVKRYAVSEDREIRFEALDVLRWMPGPGALESLHEMYRRRPFPKDDDWHEALLKGIGQHADKSSIELLGEPPRSFRNEKAVRAQILALGRIRHRLSIQALLQLMPRFGRHRDAFIADFRLSLVVLTGFDLGQDPTEWLKWWKEEKLSFRVPDALTLPPPQMKRWTRYWDLNEDRREKNGE